MKYERRVRRCGGGVRQGGERLQQLIARMQVEVDNKVKAAGGK